MWCQRKLEKISQTDRARNEKILHTYKEERNIYLHYRERRLTGWVTLCIGTAFHVTEGNREQRIEVTGRQGRRCKQLLGDLGKNVKILEIERRKP